MQRGLISCFQRHRQETLGSKVEVIRANCLRWYSYSLCSVLVWLRYSRIENSRNHIAEVICYYTTRKIKK